MRKILSFLIASLFIISCEDDSSTVVVPSDVYKGDNLSINITGINNSILDNTSVVISNYGVTVVLNNIIDPESSVGFNGKSITEFTHKTTDGPYIADLRGVVSNNVLALTGSLRYTAEGVAKSYKNKNLIVNNKPSAEEESVAISITDLEKKEISIALSNLVEGSEKPDEPFTIKGTFTDNEDGTFSFTAAGSDKLIKVDATATFVENVLSIEFTQRYTAEGIAKEYKDKALIVNGEPAAEGVSVAISITDLEKMAISVSLTKLVTGSEKPEEPFTITGTLTDNEDGTFSLTAAGSDKLVKVDATATFVDDVLSIEYTTEAIPQP